MNEPIVGEAIQPDVGSAHTRQGLAVPGPGDWLRHLRMK
jgi:hypothetical protein